LRKEFGQTVNNQLVVKCLRVRIVLKLSAALLGCKGSLDAYVSDGKGEDSIGMALYYLVLLGCG
jgi:hypothetical protein